MSSKEMPTIVYGGTEEQRLSYLQNVYPQAAYSHVAIARKGQSYGVEDIKAFKEMLTLKHSGKGKHLVYYFQDPGVMTEQAQQSLLLLLEDLPVHTTVVFLTDDVKRYLPTIISRSFVVPVKRNSTTENIEVLPNGTLSDAIAFAADYTDKDQVSGLILAVLQQLRSRMYQQKQVRDAVMYIQKMYYDLQRTTVSPRVIAELVCMIYVRLSHE